jgi:hypothetical protein
MPLESLNEKGTNFSPLSAMLTFDKTTLFYYSISTNVIKSGQTGVIKNWANTVADARAVGAAISNSYAALSTLCPSTTFAGLQPNHELLRCS